MDLAARNVDRGSGVPAESSLFNASLTFNVWGRSGDRVTEDYLGLGVG